MKSLVRLITKIVEVCTLYKVVEFCTLYKIVGQSIQILVDFKI